MDLNAKGKCLTLLGISSVQRYVFASNRLRENAGASYLAWRALEDWRHKYEEMGACDFLFAGGGNAALLFKTDTAARKAIGRWSRDYLDNACGLRLTASNVIVESTLQAAFSNAEEEIQRAENGPPPGFEFGALPVVRSCPSTGLAASEFDRTSRDWLSREAYGKRQAIERANRRLYEDFPCEGLTFPLELEDLGMREGASQIAIVHADGNGIGRKRSEIVHGRSLDDQAFSTKLAAFSEEVNKSAREAFRAVLGRLRSALPVLANEGVRIASKDGSPCFPLRPIIYGGDDLTFVCHGRLGLALAALYMREFESQGSFTACAGVLIMPQKFPFARGYALAEELCTSAKRKRNDQHDGGSWLDFQILLEGTTGSLDELREPYSAADGKALTKRPYRLDEWAICENLWREFRNTWPRNRAKRLFEVLARGKDETQAFLANLTEHGNLPDAGDGDMRKHGWNAHGVTAYFDPLELLDFHVDSRLFSEEGAKAHAAD